MSPSSMVRRRSGLYVPRNSGAYDAAVLADSPAVYYKMADPAATFDAADSSGNGRTITHEGSPAFGASALVSGDSQTSVSLSGGACFGLAHASWMDVSTVTFEAIVKTTVPTQVTHQVIVALDDTGTNLKLRFVITNSQFVGIYNGGSGVIATSTAPVTTAEAHVALVAGPAAVLLYVNGTLLVSNPGFSLPTTSAGLRIGGLAGGPQGFSGLMARVAVYTSALSATRIAAHAALV